MKRDFLALLLMLATAFSGDAFALRQLSDMEELVSPVSVKDIYDWFTAPSQELLYRWKFLLSGIRSAMVNRQQVGKVKLAERLSESGSGYLIYDGMKPIE